MSEKDDNYLNDYIESQKHLYYPTNINPMLVYSSRGQKGLLKDIIIMIMSCGWIIGIPLILYLWQETNHYYAIGLLIFCILYFVIFVLALKNFLKLLFFHKKERHLDSDKYLKSKHHNSHKHHKK